MMQFDLFAPPVEIPGPYPWEREPTVTGKWLSDTPDGVLFVRPQGRRTVTWFKTDAVLATIRHRSSGGFRVIVSTATNTDADGDCFDAYPAALDWMRGAIARAMGVA